MTGHRHAPWIAGLVVWAVIGVLLAAALRLNNGGLAVDTMSRGQIVGTGLMFATMPAFLCCMFLWQRQRSEHLFDLLQPYAAADALAAARQRFRTAPPSVALFGLAGICFGLAQNRGLLRFVLFESPFAILDGAFLLANSLLWGLIGMLLRWKLHQSLGLNTLGARLELDLYTPARARPLAQYATVDVLIIGGCLALTPLQALDAELRSDNYIWALVVGLPAAIALFLLPLQGVHRLTSRAKSSRLEELRNMLAKTPRKDVKALETLCAHIDRIEGQSSWPIDLRLIAKILGYVVVAPLAWVAAALVEQLIDTLT